MKTPREHFFDESARNLGVPKKIENGSATVIFLALMAIMLMLVTAESYALFQLRSEVKLLEQRQIKRLNHVPPAPVTVIKPDSK